MGVNDLRNILFFNSPIPNSFGIGDHHRPVLAQAEAAAGSHLNLMAQPLGIKFSLQSLQNPQRTLTGTRRDSFRLSLSTNEYVLMKGLHVRAPVILDAGSLLQRRLHSAASVPISMTASPVLHL